MGLDSSLYKKVDLTEEQRLYNRLVGEQDEMKELLYWRKNYNLLTWFNGIMEVENCEYMPISREIFEAWLEALENGELNYNRGNEAYPEEVERDIKMIKQILEDDFEETKYYFYNWW